MMIRTIIQSVVEGMIKRVNAIGRASETFPDREYFQHYGFTSRPKNGAEGIIIKEGTTYIMIATDDRRYRIAIADGEVALYDDLGQSVHLKRSGIEITAPAKITLTAPLVEVVASTKVNMTTPLLDVSGEIEDLERKVSGDRAIFNTHTHPDPQGGNTNVPNQQM